MDGPVDAMQFPTTRPDSYVLETPAVDPAAAAQHYATKAALETDPSDVHADLTKGVKGFVVLDARGADSFAREHVPGALTFPYRTMTTETVRTLPKDKVIVVYCSGPHCNASTKGALRLSSFGFRVKEMIGGLWGWKKEGYATETGAPMRAPTLAKPA